MKHQRLMTLLPALPEKPEAPPAPLEEVLEHMKDSLSGDHWKAADALLQYLDCLNVEAVLLERDFFDERALRDRDHIEGLIELPDYMAEFITAWKSGGGTGGYPMKDLWRGYFANMLETARETKSGFLADWATWEVSLRNALAEARAEAAGMSADDHLAERPHNEPNHEDLLLRLRDASDPLVRQKYLDGERLAAIEGFRGTDPFSMDSVLAYLASCLILERWKFQDSPDPQALLKDMG